MNPKTTNIIIAVLFILMLAAIAFSAVLYQEKMANIPKGSASPSPEAVVQKTAAPVASDEPVATATPISKATVTPSAQPTTSSAPVVVIKGKATLPAKDLSELQQKVIDPYIMYYSTNSDKIVSITVEPNTQASSKEYPYKFEAILKSGANNGFLVLKTAEGLDWWVPECLNKCEFTKEFAEKYPEIVKKSQ
jgi:hypothetical protein